MHTESHYILQGVRAGAKGVVLKTHASEDLVRAIREASRGGTYTLIWRNVATSLVVFPSAINWRTCRSLGLRGSGRSSVFPANLTNFLSTCCAFGTLDEVPVHVHRFAARAPCDWKGSECQCGIHTAEAASALRSRKTERAAKEKPTPISQIFLAPTQRLGGSAQEPARGAAPHLGGWFRENSGSFSTG